MKDEMADQNLKPNVKVIHLGQGKVVSNWGAYHGVPCVFLEPVVGEAGTVGECLKDGEEPQITTDSVSEGGVVLVFHSYSGAELVMEDIRSALSDTAPPETKLA